MRVLLRSALLRTLFSVDRMASAVVRSLGRAAESAVVVASSVVRREFLNQFETEAPTLH